MTINNNIGKKQYINLIDSFDKRDLNLIYNYLENYPPSSIKKCLVRQIIFKMQDFEYALMIYDCNSLKELKKLLIELKNKKNNKINTIQLINLYNNSCFKKDILHDDIYLKFKPLIASKDLTLYKSIYYYYLFKPELNNKVYKIQSYNELKFNIDVNKNTTLMIKLLVLDLIRRQNVYITENTIILKNECKLKEKTIIDRQIEALVLIKILHESNKDEIIKVVKDLENKDEIVIKKINYLLKFFD